MGEPLAMWVDNKFSGDAMVDIPKRMREEFG